jgi:hypothetical protein
MALKTITFNYTGIMQTWIPPEGVYRIKIECYGAKGGGSMMNGSVNSNGAKGGYCCGEYTFERNTQRQLYIYMLVVLELMVDFLILLVGGTVEE